ncbi:MULTISPECIES: hypothetical protein [Enterococcus]|uniref:hypothetical protein n=1 Tax=Enterococcus TaxID=1350 RepID=UPI001106FCC9|nr:MULTISPECIES: hypothetical protein [Enterococcus]MDB1680040.1 hypothetical protein [Enterococcus durans]
MKKWWIVIPAILFLGACQTSADRTTQKQENQEKDQSHSQVTQMTTETSTGESAKGKEEHSDAKTGTNQTQKTAFEQLKAEQPTLPMPQVIPISSGNLNLAAAQSKQGYTVLYYALPEKLALNAQALNQETPIATYLYQYGFASSQETINVLQPFTIDKNGQKVDLGHQIIAYQQGAAGSNYLEWQEGNWRIRVRSSNIEGQDPLPLAKKIVNYLEKATLPAPEKYGKITVDMNDSSNQATQVIWQEPNNVFTVTHQDALAALEMAVSMN